MSTDSDTVTPDRALPAAGRAPVAAPAAGYVGALIAVLMLSIGVIALRDSAVSAGWLDGRPWLTSAIDWFDGLTVQWWTIPAGIAAIVVGLWWLSAAVRPRRKTAVAVAAATSVWIAPADLARIASRTAEEVPGVLDARSTANRRRIKVIADVTAEGDGRALKTVIADSVRENLAALSSPPKVKARTRIGGR